MTEAFGQVISEREVASATAKEQELLKNTPNPSGNGAGADTQTSAEKIAASLYSGGNANGGDDILSHYINQ